MVKQAPTFARIATMAAFALSCFGLLLFLWISFGGATPLKAKGYRFEAVFPEATQLAAEADVQVAGVQVGKVRRKFQDKDRPNLTVAVIELEPRYAPVAEDARAVLRQKTLLGETFVELQLGTRTAAKLPEGGRLDPNQIAGTTQLDELLGTFDPMTRAAFRTWQRELGAGVAKRGQDLNDALGSLPGFVSEGSDLFSVLDEQRASLRGLVRNTGVVFKALSQREGQLQALLRNGDIVFTAIQRQRESWAQTWKIMPTFLDESKATFDRLERFSKDTEPLLVDLEPAIEDLGPTLESVGDLAPDLRRLFLRLDPLITASQKSLPATTEIFDGVRPLLGELGPWLSQLNPIVDWIGQHQQTLTDLFANLGVATAAKTPSGDPQATGHYLRQVGPTGVETVAFQTRRIPGNRGNAYINPAVLNDKDGQRLFTVPSFDCFNAGGERDPGGVPAASGCLVQKPLRYRGRAERFPVIRPDDYTNK
jgi:phospholipid/cholesterol/gamma-HCH transport system substrate-binding protein